MGLKKNAAKATDKFIDDQKRKLEQEKLENKL